MELDGRVDAVTIYCLVCGINPLARCDLDGLCLSCRAAVADEQYKVEYVAGFGGSYRSVTFATAAEHMFGVEGFLSPDPIPYEPERLPERWRDLDEEQEERERAESVLETLTAWG